MKSNLNSPGWVAGWLYEHENKTNSASKSVEDGAGAGLGNEGLVKLSPNFN